MAGPALGTAEQKWMKRGSHPQSVHRAGGEKGAQGKLTGGLGRAERGWERRWRGSGLRAECVGFSAPLLITLWLMGVISASVSPMRLGVPQGQDLCSCFPDREPVSRNE